MEERIQKILAHAGLGSRRACEAYLLAGRVTVNGVRAELGQKADPARDRIALDGEPVAASEAPVYVALNKPRGVVSSLAAQGQRQTVRDLVPLPGRLYPVGRLDVDSEGLVLLTNDGDLTLALTHPSHEVEKEYRVLVKGWPDETQLRTWRRGVVLDGQRTAPALVTTIEKTDAGTWLRVTMREGRKRQIREVALLLGLPVQRLIRTRLGTLTLGTLQLGRWRLLKPGEVDQLREVARRPRPVRRPAAKRTTRR